MNTIQPPETIDDIIARLRGIVEHSIETGDRLGYFAALYLRVTLAVREGIAAGSFDDGPRMERLDVTFAGRYLTAYDQYRSGEMPSRAWAQAFEAAKLADLIVLQHLFVGMNAHINLDLGVAAARTAPGAELPGLRADFDKINGVLASLTPTVEGEVDAISPDFVAITAIAPKLELHAVGFGMELARAEAWKLAVALADLTPRDQVAVMTKRDGEAVIAGDLVLHRGLIVHEIRKKECVDVPRNIELLARGELAKLWTAAHPA